ncbi:MAG: Flp pilus assembly complex ATPase component TadA [Bacteroidetes bacterium]|nr:Flp pilus assembly complex ATPase component TadA [Bacteroidota bacterium]
MNISLSSIGKKFGSEWIFRELSAEIKAGDKLFISGGNGSGKSTLLQVISGFITPNEGRVSYMLDNKEIETDSLKNYISLASPYLQLIEDFTLTEAIEHSKIFKPFINKISTVDVLEIFELSNAKNKFIKQFSSGMKQRLKLGLAILADAPLLLLDEPVSNLDKNAIMWYKSLIQTYASHRTVIVCSNNIDDEHFFCTSQLNLADYKAKKSAV